MLSKVCIVVAALALAVPTVAAESWVDAIEAPQFFAVHVEDVDRSVAWYTAALGVKTRDDTSADDGRWRIVNMRNDRLSVEIIHDRRNTAAGRVYGIRKVGFQVPDVEKVADRVEAATGTRPRIVDFDEHAIRILQLKDPDDNTIQLSSPLSESGD